LALLLTSAALVGSAGIVESGCADAVTIPQVVRDSVMERFPEFIIWAVTTTGSGDKKEYEVTVIDAPTTNPDGQRKHESMSYARTTYKIVVLGTGEVLSEEPHAIPEDSVPIAALATLWEWRRTRPAGMVTVWGAYQERDEERLYVANIIVNAIESHILVTNQDGIVIRESEI